MSQDIAIKVENVSKKYCKTLKRSMLYGMSDISRNMLGLSSHSEKLRKDEFLAVNDVSFEVKRGETLGIIGPNGSGKTTLLKMLNGIFWPDKGKITINGRVGALIEVGAGFHPLLSGRENIYINAAILGMTKKEVDKKFDAIVEFADIGDFLDAPVKHYSSGMYVRLGFAVAVHCEPDILLIDEVLAVGDEGFQMRCFSKLGELKKKGTTVVLVSHNMHAISTFVEKVALLNKRRLKYFDDVAEGILEYTNLFIGNDDSGIEKICSGDENIKFFDIELDNIFAPGTPFSIVMKYDSLLDFNDVIIDTVIIGANDFSLYFQSTNRAYKKKVDLQKGRHTLKLTIENIPLNNSTAKIIIAISPKKKSGYLFWWRIPVKFTGIQYSTGKNYLNVSYMLE